jgi:RimJ/RimL family protein N-acetyltransferase
VLDEWQGRGLGTLLLEVLSARALDEGVGRFTAPMLARNQAMMDRFERLGQVQLVGRAAGTVEIEVAIPAVAVGPELRELLRRARRQGAAAPR